MDFNRYISAAEFAPLAELFRREGESLSVPKDGCLSFQQVRNRRSGLVFIKEISNRYIQSIEDELQVGQTVRVKVLKVDKEAKRISLSIREALTEEVDYNAEVQGLDFDDLGDAPADDAE